MSKTKAEVRPKVKAKVRVKPEVKAKAKPEVKPEITPRVRPKARSWEEIRVSIDEAFELARQNELAIANFFARVDRADEKRRIEDEKRRAEEAERRAEEEKRRVEEEKRRAEEDKRRAAEEKRRAAEEKRRAAEEKRRAAEEAERRAEEEKRRAEEEKRRAAEEEKRRVEEAERGKRIDDLVKSVKGINEEVTGIGKSNGLVSEGFFSTAIKKTMTVGGIHFDDMMINMRNFSKRAKTRGQYDIVLINDDAVCLVEIKYRLRVKDVREVAEKNPETFRLLFPEYRDYKIYLAVAGVCLDDASEDGIDAERTAKELGVGVLKPNGDTVEADVGGPLKVF